MRKIVEAEDILAAARDCLECVCLAAETLDKHQRGPILRVADIARAKVEEAIILLGEYRQPADAPDLTVNA